MQPNDSDSNGEDYISSLNPDPTQRHSFLSLVVGGMIGWVSTYGCSQASVQRYCSVSSLADAKKSVCVCVCVRMCVCVCVCVCIYI